MSNSFANERQVFSALQESMRADAELRQDVEKAFDLLLQRYSTSIRENRFIVGGVAERIVAATFRAMNLKSYNLGLVVEGADLQVGTAKFSLKGMFSRSKGDVRLVNVMGPSTTAEWVHATIFMISGLGFGYADPHLIPSDQVRRTSDALVLRYNTLRALWDERPNLLIPLSLPVSRADVAGSEVASRLVADQILRSTKRLRPSDDRPAFDLPPTR